MEDGHAKTVEEVLTYFRTDEERGLSLDQVKSNQAKYGPNGKFFLSIKFIEFAIKLCSFIKITIQQFLKIKHVNESLISNINQTNLLYM